MKALIFGSFVLSLALACTTTTMPQGAAVEPVAEAPRSKSEFFEVNGVKLHVLTQGKGPLIVFLHGFPEYSGMWTQLLDEFGRDHQVVAPDMRGYNLSSQPTGVPAYSIDLLTRDVVELVKALGHKKATLVAHDWGGIVAWFAVDRYPEVFDRLVILNSPHPKIYSKLFKSDPEQQKKSQYIYTLTKDNAEEIVSAKDFALLDKAIFDSSKKPFTAQEKAGYRAAWAKGMTGPLNYYRYFLKNLDKEAGKMKTIKVPSLVLWGEQDQALSIKNLNGLDKLVPNLTIRRFADVTHWIAHEIPERVIPEIRGFMGGSNPKN